MKSLRVFFLLWLIVTSDAGLNALQQHSLQQREEEGGGESDVVCVREHELKEMCQVLSESSSSSSENRNISLLELNTRRSKRRRRKIASKQLTQVGAVDPFTMAVVTTGVIWASLYLVQMATKSLSMHWLKKRDRGNRDKIALAVKETCHFVSNVYDRLRFQKHAILAVLELFAADTEGNPIKLTAFTTQTHPEFQSWIEFLRELEYSMLTFYKMFGEDTLCPIFKDPPDFHFVSTMTELFDEDDERDHLDVEDDFVPIRFRHPERKCAPQVMIDWIRKESHRFGLFSWDEARRFYCGMSDEDLRDAWNTEFEWNCLLDDVRHFRIANCHDASEEDLDVDHEDMDLEDLDVRDASLSEEEDRDPRRTSSSDEEEEEENSQTPSPEPTVGIWGSLSHHAMRAIRRLLQPLGMLQDSPRPHSLASDTCEVFGSGSSEQCSDLSRCEWVEDVSRCVPSSSITPPSSPRESFEESHSGSLESVESESVDLESVSVVDLESVSDVESTRTDPSRTASLDDVEVNASPLARLNTPMLPESFSSKVRGVRARESKITPLITRMSIVSLISFVSSIYLTRKSLENAHSNITKT